MRNDQETDEHGDRPTIPVARPALPDFDRFVEAARDIYERRSLSNFGKYCRRLERRAATVLDHPDPICVSSCDVGMVLAWKALGCVDGEVVVPSFTLCSTVNALRWNGLTPVFADIDPRTLCIDPERVRSLIGPHTVGIAAVHVFGRPAPVVALESLAREHQLKLVFDAAHALGSQIRGRGMGAFGDASVFSLSGTKVATSGEGGLATFRDPASARRFRRLRNYGFLGDYDCHEVGLNGKLAELNAALGWLSLGRLGRLIRRRRRLARLYKRRLASCSGLRFQRIGRDDLHSFKDFAVLFERSEQREQVEIALRRRGIETKRYFLPVHRMKAYARFADRPLPVTDDVHDRLLCLPLYHELRSSQVRLICQVVQESLTERGRTHAVA